MRSCETCKFAHVFWRKGDEYEWQSDYAPFEKHTSTRPETLAQCRRHAPRMAQGEYQQDGWPSVCGDDWCGEYQVKSNA